MIARRKISIKRGPVSATGQCSGLNGKNYSSDVPHEEENAFCLAPPGEVNLADPMDVNLVTDAGDSIDGSRILQESKGDGKPVRLSLVSVSSLEHISERTEPPGWCLVNSSFDEFPRIRKEWSLVDCSTDLAIFDVPAHEKIKTILTR